MASDPQVSTRNIIMKGSYSLPEMTAVIRVTAVIETKLPTDEVVERVRTAGYGRVGVRDEGVVVNIGHIRGAGIDDVLPTLYRLAAD